MLLYDDINKIGKIKNGELIIDKNKEEKWLIDNMTVSCKSCPVSMSCLNKKCPASILSQKKNNCLFNTSELDRLLILMDKQNLMTYSIG